MSAERVRALWACALVGCLAACGGAGAPADRVASDSLDGSDSSAPTPDTAAWTAGTVSAPSTVQEAVAVLGAIRTGSHDGFERVTLKLGGAGTGFPSYHVEYIDRPLIECGSGREIHPVGDAWLEIRMEPLDAHTQEGQPTVPHTPQDIPGLANLERVYMTCDFEAVTTVVFAVASPNDFRVLTLEGPRRIVVDVRN